MSEEHYSIPNIDSFDDLSSVLSTVNRTKAYDLLAQGYSGPEISDELDVTRSAVQPYIDDYKESGLIEIHGKEYELTDKGEWLHATLQQTGGELGQHLYERSRDDLETALEEADIEPEEALERLQDELGDKD